MTRILHIDASARTGIRGRDPHGSHSRALTERFVARWRSADPAIEVTTRDVGRRPPRPVMQDWLAAAFTPACLRDADMRQVLRESDELIDELRAADVVLIGSPMYNYGPPSALKSWIDNVVRADVTFAFDAQAQQSHMPLLVDKPRAALLFSSRGEPDLGPGGKRAHRNHLDPIVRQAFELIGITQMHCVAIENDEFGGQALDLSVRQAVAQVDALVDVFVNRAGAGSPRSTVQRSALEQRAFQQRAQQ